MRWEFAQGAQVMLLILRLRWKLIINMLSWVWAGFQGNTWEPPSDGAPLQLDKELLLLHPLTIKVVTLLTMMTTMMAFMKFLLFLLGKFHDDQKINPVFPSWPMRKLGWAKPYKSKVVCHPEDIEIPQHIFIEENCSNSEAKRTLPKEREEKKNQGKENQLCKERTNLWHNDLQTTGKDETPLLWIGTYCLGLTFFITFGRVEKFRGWEV